MPILLTGWKYAKHCGINQGVLASLLAMADIIKRMLKQIPACNEFVDLEAKFESLGVSEVEEEKAPPKKAPTLNSKTLMLGVL